MNEQMTSNELMESEELASKRGRPLDKSRDAIILEAALQLVAEKGYEPVTMDAIAHQARVGKATIYRRWNSKLDLISSALVYITPSEWTTTLESCKGSLRQYLCKILADYIGLNDEIRHKVLLSVAAAMCMDKELSNFFQYEYVAKQRDAMHAAIKQAVSKVNGKSVKNVDMAADTGPALLFYQMLTIREPIDMAYIERIVDEVMLPLLFVE